MTSQRHAILEDPALEGNHPSASRQSSFESRRTLQRLSAISE